MSYQIIDKRVISVELDDDTIVYLPAETKRLIDLNKHLAQNDLSYTITHIDEPTEKQRASAELNERAEQLVFLPK